MYIKNIYADSPVSLILPLEQASVRSKPTSAVNIQPFTTSVILLEDMALMYPVALMYQKLLNPQNFSILLRTGK